MRILDMKHNVHDSTKVKKYGIIEPDCLLGPEYVNVKRMQTQLDVN
jgi:hypothetical protein